MKPFESHEKEDSPFVIMDAENNNFMISGKSLPEDTFSFYGPILAWLKEYSANPNPKTEFNFKLIYFNTATSKSIVDILILLENIKKCGHDVIVKWHYPEDDEDIQDSGEEFANIIDIPFEQIPYEY
ncbi:MAG: nuclear pore complex subunit [Bacteroidetes bacterium GWF2_38_335]|nr:MAG: nuclear pore complex subunit [Bacteroidetes bacterium GWF2_38_335]OFY78568.1 MAG: nuclear pore complex subunit [Bacteroidetes bacterium RIFOXYA12_FULL_38_20]HBS85064.1 nuclear pore complex subunit [Bacteroidales bacterium]